MFRFSIESFKAFLNHNGVKERIPSKGSITYDGIIHEFSVYTEKELLEKNKAVKEQTRKYIFTYDGVEIESCYLPDATFIIDGTTYYVDYMDNNL